jgi:hypothetical protein
MLKGFRLHGMACLEVADEGELQLWTVDEIY